MAIAQVQSAAVIGLDCQIVTVEVDINNKGLAAFQIVGLPDAAVNESRERVRSAILNSGLSFPARRIIVNLAPADLPKTGPIYDLPIAISILLASGQIAELASQVLVIGELALNGAVRPISGVLPMAIKAKKSGFKQIILPAENVKEASLIDEIKVFPIKTLVEIINLTSPDSQVQPYQPLSKIEPGRSFDQSLDFCQIRGQYLAKRALEIVATGFHNVLLHGPPGSGKTLLARTLPTIMPPLTKDEILEISQIYSVCGLLTAEQPLMLARPFRSPHHTASAISLIGGGTQPKPGEITLAHRGILFLDELPEFPRHVLEALRQPLEDRLVIVARAAGSCRFPAHFILVAAYNPCPCGNLYDPKVVCHCTQSQILRYQKRLSGPLLDRIDLHVEVPRVKTEQLVVDFNQKEVDSKGLTSLEIRRRVILARQWQNQRFQGTGLASNAEMGPKEIEKFCPLNPECLKMIKVAIDRLNLSARSYHRILKISRSIADLAQSEVIKEEHLTEALQYRAQNKS